MHLNDNDPLCIPSRFWCCSSPVAVIRILPFRHFLQLRLRPLETSDALVVIGSGACYQGRLVQQYEWSFSRSPLSLAPNLPLITLCPPSKGVAQQPLSSEMNAQPQKHSVELANPFETPIAASKDQQRDARLSQATISAAIQFKTFLGEVKEQTSPETWLSICHNMRHMLQSMYVNTDCLHSS